MNYIVLQKQQPIFIIAKSLSQYPNMKVQKSDEIQPLKKYEKSIVPFDDMLLSKQGSSIDLISIRGRHENIDIYYLSKFFSPAKKKFVIIQE